LDSDRNPPASRSLKRGDETNEALRDVLRHSSDTEPGISRKRQGRYWAYFDSDGKRITDRDEIDRLNAVGLPPAYEKAWFCADPNGHLQATGIDARGRKQYRYHADFRAKRESAKYEGLLEFGKCLPKLRRRVERDLKRRSLTREAVLAAVVRLLDTEHIRIGNEEYARANKSYGATTLRSRHLRKTGHGLMMRFTGKHGIVHEVKVTDTNLKSICKRCQELPGQMLFQYVNGDGEPKPVTSNDVNDYIKEATGADFTAKHFRTWSASVIAFDQLLRKSESSRISIKTVVEPVAEALGNTVAMSRKSYVHPALLEAVKEDSRDPLDGMDRPRSRARLSSEEVGLLEFLARGHKRTRRRKPTGKEPQARATAAREKQAAA
jgi:DNA topoisomerase-1